MKVALAQINPVIGDFSGNAGKVVDCYRRAQERGAELVVFSELCLCGYPPLDLLARRDFLLRCEAELDELAARLGPVPALVGCATLNPGPVGRLACNSAVLMVAGRRRAQVAKTHLPSYDVFDEDRYFEPATGSQVLEVNGRRLAVTICEDIWPGPGRRPLYHRDPLEQLAGQQPELLVNLSASPFELGKSRQRLQLLADQARRLGVPAVLVNQVGGNDELLFDGRSLAVSGTGKLLARAGAFVEDLLLVDLDAEQQLLRPAPDDGPAELRAALAMGISDYARKCGFERAVLGLSGGIDSAVCAVLAADALGADNLQLLAMPSVYSSPQSAALAEQLARRLGARLEKISIQPVLDGFLEQLAAPLGRVRQTLVEENLQARIRGTLVMAFANHRDALALATGNKSELATGYCTLYGDMAGGLAPIGDVLKTQVYQLARHCNEGGQIIPPAIIERPPSAELRPGQLDSDSLPPYRQLDQVLRLYLDEGLGQAQIVEKLGDGGLVERVLSLVERTEFKRRQAAPVLRVTRKAFGQGRRIPMARVPGV
ncbi:MAG: NAD+ synthase [Deltaproteobacteria bacterium]|nr:MAG: NAD+ synthase [Deltaproteobacteria bacterium]